MPARAVRFGVYLPAFGPFGDPAVLAELGVRAEASGWDGVFLWDHLVRADMPIADAWTSLAAMAHATALARAGLSTDRPFDIAVAGNASPAWRESFQVDPRRAGAR